MVTDEVHRYKKIEADNANPSFPFILQPEGTQKQNTKSLNAQILPLALSAPELLTDGGCDYYVNV